MKRGLSELLHRLRRTTRRHKWTLLPMLDKPGSGLPKLYSLRDDWGRCPLEATTPPREKSFRGLSQRALFLGIPYVEAIVDAADGRFRSKEHDVTNLRALRDAMLAAIG